MTRDSVQQEAVAVRAADRYEIAATHFFRADRPNPLGTVLFSSATAVPQTFYAGCAQFFAEQDWDAYTYDYRGIGRSAPDSLKGFEASMECWARKDIVAMIDYVADRHPRQPLTYLAHSVGGQLLGLADNANRVDQAVFVSSQLGYWKLQGGSEKCTVGFFTYVLIPVISRLFGYLPWSKFASGEDLPSGVARQWARWCRHQNYLFDDPTLGDLSGFSQCRFPILAYCISDDDWGTPAAVRGLVDRYTGADVQYRDVTPERFGWKHLGHFGFFKRGRQPLWQDALQWIQSQTQNQT